MSTAGNSEPRIREIASPTTKSSLILSTVGSSAFPWLGHGVCPTPRRRNGLGSG